MPTSFSLVFRTMEAVLGLGAMPVVELCAAEPFWFPNKKSICHQHEATNEQETCSRGWVKKKKVQP